MRRSDRDLGADPAGRGTREPVRTGRDPFDESWDPADDAPASGRRPSGAWDWRTRSSWGQRAVAAFPVGALAVAAVLLAAASVAASGAAAPVVVTGTDGAQLVALPGAPVPADPTAPGGEARYGVVDFDVPSGPGHPIQGSTSIALPPYVGWEANGSAGPSNGQAAVSGGLLHVGIRTATSQFRGWFLTTTGSVPDSCAFQFDAASPPPVVRAASTTPATAGARATGELVMAVQTASTARTGDINYAVVSESVAADGRRFLEAGYATGRVRNAVEHVLKRVPWAPGPLAVSVVTDGEDRLQVWVDGWPFLDASGLRMGIEPPFQPYLEVQAVGTPYSVAFSRYASVCGDDVVVDGLPAATMASLAGQMTSAVAGQATFPLGRSSAPLAGELRLRGTATAPVTFASHSYWPGDRYAYRPGP